MDLSQWGQLLALHTRRRGVEEQWSYPFTVESRLLLSLGGHDGTSVEAIGLGCGLRFGNELSAVALVDACLAIKHLPDENEKREG